MNYEVKVTKQAHGQMREIAMYIANECCAPEAAQNLLDKLEASINDLAEMPKRHSLVDKEPWRSEGVRKVIVKNFLHMEVRYNRCASFLLKIYSRKAGNVADI
jgi:plasmid stabilization system protein ParE